MTNHSIIFYTAICITIGLASCTSDPSVPDIGDAEPDLAEITLPDEAIPDSARIIFFGDSITEAGALPGGYVWLVDSLLQAAYPGKGIEVIGAGISGNKVPDLLARVEEDVLALDPTILVIYIGINDVWHWFRFDPLGTEKPVFEQGLRELIQQIESAGAEVILCTPSVIGEDPSFSTDEDAMLEEYAAVSRTVATETGVHLCDLRESFKRFLSENNREGAEEGVLTTDGVHLNARGNRFVAREMARCLVSR